MKLKEIVNLKQLNKEMVEQIIQRDIIIDGLKKVIERYEEILNI